MSALSQPSGPNWTYQTVACNNFVISEISANTGIFVGNRTFGWSSQRWDFTLNNFGTPTAEPSLRALYSIKVPPRNPFTDQPDYFRVCANVGITKIQKSTLSGNIHLGQLDCSENGENAWGYLESSKHSWEIAGGNISDCFQHDFERSEEIGYCDQLVLGFEFSAPTKLAVTFYVTWRIDALQGIGN